MFSKKCYEYWNVVGSMSLVGGIMITVICLMTENSINSLEKDYHYGVPEPIQWNYTNCQIKSVNLVEEIPGLAFDRVIVEIPSGYQINSDSWCCAIGEFRYVRTVNWTEEQYGNYTANLRKRFVPGESRECGVWFWVNPNFPPLLKRYFLFIQNKAINEIWMVYLGYILLMLAGFIFSITVIWELIKYLRKPKTIQIELVEGNYEAINA